MARRPAAAPPGPRHAWEHGFLEPREISLIKAMAAQHGEAFDVVLFKVCRINAMSFAAGGEDGRRETDFAEGMKFVGHSLRNARDAKLPTRGRGAPPSDLPNAPTLPAEPKS